MQLVPYGLANGDESSCSLGLIPEPRQPAKDPDTPHLFYRLHIILNQPFVIFFSGIGKNHPENRYLPDAKGFKGEQGMVQGAEAASGDYQRPELHPGHQICQKQLPLQRNQYAAHPFNDEPLELRGKNFVIFQDDLGPHGSVFHFCGQVR